MKWIQISNRQPEDWEEVIIRRISNRLQVITDIVTVHRDSDSIIIPTRTKFSNEEIPFEDLEWLDESSEPSPTVVAGKIKPFIVANVREITDLYDKEEISYSRMVEMLNEIAFKFFGYTVVGKEERIFTLAEILHYGAVSAVKGRDMNVIDYFKENFGVDITKEDGKRFIAPKEVFDALRWAISELEPFAHLAASIEGQLPFAKAALSLAAASPVGGDAVEFAEWIDINGWDYLSNHVWINENLSEIHSSELYQLFIKSKTV